MIHFSPQGVILTLILLSFFEDSKYEDIEDLKDVRSVRWVGNNKNPAPGQSAQYFIGTMSRAIIAAENCGLSLQSGRPRFDMTAGINTSLIYFLKIACMT
jgi:hypothetical protein